MTLPSGLPDAFGALLRRVAETDVMPWFRKLTESDVREKTGADDLVTSVDLRAELAITAGLREILPGAVIIGEEGAAADPSVLRALGGPGPVLVVDPLDGTWNFAHGIPIFAMMIGLCLDGVPAAGAIFLPCTSELVLAERGAGATLNGAPLRTRREVPFAEAAGDFSRKFATAPLRERFAAPLRGAGSTSQRNCSGVAYVDTAAGRNDFMLQFLLMPWDHVAGALIVAEAGGATRYLVDGADYQPGRLAPEPLLTAGDAEKWAAYAAALSAS